MTTSEIIQTLAARLKITQREARLHLRSMFTAISNGLQRGETVVVHGFGSLNAAPGKPLRTFDAASQQFIPPPSKIEFFFRPYKRLKDRLKEWRPT
jgi:nucleoid DNA-binding protein